MILRQATIEDKKSILEIVNMLHLDVLNFVWNNDDFVEKQIERKEYFLIESDDIVVGIMSLRQRKNGMHIETLAVKKEFQSKGFGTKLVEFAKKITKENGLDFLHAYSFSEYNMTNFYLKKGFKMMDYVGFYGGRKYYCFEMAL